MLNTSNTPLALIPAFKKVEFTYIQQNLSFFKDYISFSHTHQLHFEYPQVHY